jgi:hypothetical protein
MASLGFLAGWVSDQAGRTVACSLAVGLLLLLPAAASAAPPPNDDFADAQEITGLPVEATGSNVDATREPDEPTAGENSIWFRWTAPRDAGITVNFFGCSQPFQETVSASLHVEVFTQSSVWGFVRVPPIPFLRVVAGRVYWIALSSSNSPPDPDICLRLLAGPANDDFADATRLTGFPVSATHTPQSNEGGATRQAGEPVHEGPLSTNSGVTPGASLWYSWAAPADGPTFLRACGNAQLAAVYTGDHVDALTWVATGRSGGGGCGSLPGASLTLNAVKDQVYRIAVVSSGGSFQLLFGNQVAVIAGDQPAFIYTAFPGQTDSLDLRVTETRHERAVLFEAAGVAAANGCEADITPGLLRCPMPHGSVGPSIDIDLGDGDDAANIRLLGTAFSGTVRGGHGNDTLTGSAGVLGWRSGWDRGGLLLSGGPGEDRLRSERGADQLRGGRGSDQLDAGPGRDLVDGGSGEDRIRTLDGFSDIINCRAGRDQARVDGFDLPTDCERRSLSGRARAVASGASIGNDDGESDEYLEVVVVCPLDARGGCRTRVSAAVPGGRAITSRSFRLGPGRTRSVRFYRLVEDQLVRRGVRVKANTRRPGGATLKFTDRLTVFDDRYTGE